MKSLVLGLAAHEKPLFLYVFRRFFLFEVYLMSIIKLCNYNSPVFINPAWFLTISRQYEMRYYPVFINPAWLLNISRQCMMRKYPVFINPVWLWTLSCQYIFGLRH